MVPFRTSRFLQKVLIFNLFNEIQKESKGYYQKLFKKKHFCDSLVLGGLKFSFERIISDPFCFFVSEVAIYQLFLITVFYVGISYHV